MVQVLPRGSCRARQVAACLVLAFWAYADTPQPSFRSVFMSHGDVASLASLIASCGDSNDLSRGRALHGSVAELHSQGRSGTYLSNLLVAMYGKCGRVVEATEVFQAIQRPNLFSWNMMLVAYAQNGYLPEAESTFHSMPEWDTVSWTALMQAYSNAGCLDKVVKVFEDMPQPNLVTWGCLITAYAHHGCLQEASRAFKSMPLRNIVSYNAMLACLSEFKQTEEAKVLFQAMPEWNTTTCTTMMHVYSHAGMLAESVGLFRSVPAKDVGCWSTLMQVYVEHGRYAEAVRVHRCLMPEHDLGSSASLATAHALSGDLDRARAAFDAMPEHSVVSYNAMVTAYARSGDVAGLDAAASLLERSREWSLASWIPVVAGYCQLGRLAEAEAAYGSMPEHDALSSTALIAAYGCAGRVDAARHIFDAIPSSCRDAAAWNAICQVYAQNGQLQRAELLFHAMPYWTVVSWTAMVAAYAQAELMSEAERLFNGMPERNLVSWNVMLSAYARLGNPTAAQRIFARMPSPDTVSWTALLAASAQPGQGDRVVGLSRDMELEGVTPDAVCFGGVLQACSHAGLLQQACAYFVLVTADHGVPATEEHYTVLVDIYARAGQLGNAEDLLRGMPFLPPPRAWEALLAASRLHGDVKSRAARAAQNVFSRPHQESGPYVCLSNACLSTANS